MEYVKDEADNRKPMLTGHSSEEIREMIGNQVGESPELGPPPIAHFQDEDPIKFDARSSGLDGSSGDARDGGDGLPAEMSVNLETRKKRRDSSNVRRMSIFHSPPDTTDDSTKGDPIKPLKAGAKRKLSTREEDAYNDASTSLPAEEFRFNRKTTGNADLKTQAQPILAAPGRKVLGNSTYPSPICACLALTLYRKREHRPRRLAQEVFQVRCPR